MLLNNVRIISFISILFIFGFCSSLLASEIHQVGDKFYSVAPGTEYVTQYFTTGTPRIKNLKWKHTVYVDCLCIPQSYDPATQMTSFYCYKLSGGGVEEVPDPSTDTDADGLPDINDPCPDNADNFFKHYLAPNSCDGSYYFFQITGECGETKNYYNPKYSSINEAYQDAIDNPDCSATPEVKSVTPQQVQNFFDSNTGQNTASSGSGVIPEDSVDLTGGNSTSTSPQEVTSDNPDTQKVIDAIKVMRETVEETLNKQTQKIIDSENLAADRIVSTLKSGNNLVSGRLSGVENAINALKGNTASYADQAHIDALATISAINSIGVNGTGSGSGGSENGTGTGETGEGNGTASGNGTGEYGTAPVVEYSIPKEEDRPTFYNATLENEREQAAKNDLMNSWNKLTQRVETFLNLSLSGTGSLPVWDWNILGNIITIDFRDFEEIFKLIGLAILFIAAIRAFFIVFD
ncbi:MAG: hypothetical protein EOL88_13310 [Bacteroidia bacterium]|nr:hypothetical protein [Bacteroidia bacterium]